MEISNRFIFEKLVGPEISEMFYVNSFDFFCEIIKAYVIFPKNKRNEYHRKNSDTVQINNLFYRKYLNAFPRFSVTSLASRLSSDCVCNARSAASP